MRVKVEMVMNFNFDEHDIANRIENCINDNLESYIDGHGFILKSIFMKKEE